MFYLWKHFKGPRGPKKVSSNFETVVLTFKLGIGDCDWRLRLEIAIGDWDGSIGGIIKMDGIKMMSSILFLLRNPVYANMETMFYLWKHEQRNCGILFYFYYVFSMIFSGNHVLPLETLQGSARSQKSVLQL
jgi:hypothetical protein